MVHQVPTFCFTAENVGGAVSEIHRLTVNDVIDAVLGTHRVTHVIGKEKVHFADLDAPA